MMIILIFVLGSILPLGINCDNDNITVLSENKTEITVLFSRIVLNCPILLNYDNLSVIIWTYDKETIPIPYGQLESMDIITRIRGGLNGSLVIDKVQYNDSKVYKCQVYGSRLLYEVKINLLVHGPPPNFSKFNYTAVSDNVLKLNWDINVTHRNFVQRYNITLCKSLITNECKRVTIFHPQYEYTFKNLKPFSDYQASIVAINDIGTNTRSDLKVRTNPGTPKARPFVVATTANERNVTLRIECPKCSDKDDMVGTLDHFSIDYVDRNTPVHLVLKATSDKFETTISTLHPYTNYTFQVSASNGVRNGPADSVRVVTKEDIPNPTVYLRTADVTSTSIMVLWTPSSDEYGPIIGYQMKVSHGNPSIRDDVVVDLDGNISQYRLVDLKPRNPYSIKLASRNRVGFSRFAETMAQTDRPPLLRPTILDVKFLPTFVRVEWRNMLPLNETAAVSYGICWAPVSHNKFGSKCHHASPNGNGKLKCNCRLNSSIHSVDIPVNMINLTYSQISFSVRVKVPSDLCQTSTICHSFEANSNEHTLDVNGYSTYQRKETGVFFTYTFIILLTVGCMMFIGGFVALFFVCGNRQFKQLFSPRASNVHYVRTPGDYIEVLPRQVSQPKILPLERNPYPPVPVSDLVDHIVNYRSDDGAGFQAEFEAIEATDTSRWNIAVPNTKDNKTKNRYTNIFPYDHSRVILQNPCNSKSDYINASFVDGYGRKNAYIATQGPLPDTIGDFWQMVYEQNSEIVVMISNFDERGRRKCEVYWVPNKVVCYGNMHVRQIYHKKMAFYTERRFGIKNIRNKKNANKERIVYHYQYTDWRDFDVPPSSLPVLVFVKATTRHWSASSGPIVVHCSAGVGRTGTYICIESQIRQMEMEHRINVRGFLEHIRQQRMKLVQTESQYTFIHDALYEYYLCPDHEIHKDILASYIFQLKEDSSGFSKLEEQFQMCTQFEPTNYEYIESKRPYNLSKNRSKILPIESRRINLSCEPGIEGSNYINASAIEGYWEMKEFIITQHPLENTEPDFWKMVWDENCTNIILLSNESTPQFWPADENDFRTYRCSRVNFCNYEETGSISQHNFLLSSRREDYALDCTMHRLRHWPADEAEAGDLLRLLFQINAEKNHAPVVVIDDLGGSRAGIFVALSSLLQQLRNDDVIDVYFVMKMIHMERPHTFESSADLRLVYEVLASVIASHVHCHPFFSVLPCTVLAPPSDPPPPPPAPQLSNGVCHSASRPSHQYHHRYNTLSASSSSHHRRASSVESADRTLSASPPLSSPHHRISWNPSGNDSLVDWSTAIGNGHYNGGGGGGAPPQLQITSNPIGDLEVAKIIETVLLDDTATSSVV